MKKHILALAILAAVAAPVLAQPVTSTSEGMGIAGASVGDLNIRNELNLPASPATTVAKVEQKGIPVSPTGTVYATPPAWKCTGAGDAGALQVKNFGLALSLGGDDKNVCATEFRMAVVSALAEQQKAQHPAYGANLALACTDTLIADALEQTLTMKCSNPEGVTEARKARWARERQQQLQQQRAEAILTGQPEPVATAPSLPAPWKFGG